MAAPAIYSYREVANFSANLFFTSNCLKHCGNYKSCALELQEISEFRAQRMFCYVLFVACCLLRVFCYVLFVACVLLCVVCCVLLVACVLLRVVCCVLFVACVLLRVVCCNEEELLH